MVSGDRNWVSTAQRRSRQSSKMGWLPPELEGLILGNMPC